MSLNYLNRLRFSGFMVIFVILTALYATFYGQKAQAVEPNTMTACEMSITLFDITLNNITKYQEEKKYAYALRFVEIAKGLAEAQQVYCKLSTVEDNVIEEIKDTLDSLEGAYRSALGL